MSDELLPYYNRELNYIRRLAGGFAAAHPDAASRLGVREEEIVDPHVERLVEAFAYLTARIRKKVDDEFPELTDALLDVLYPQYLAPKPSVSVVQFRLDASQGELTSGYRIGRHESIEISDSMKSIRCRYRTAYETMLWPIEVTSCSLNRRPFSAPNVPVARDALSVIQLSFKTQSKNVVFSGFDSDKFNRLRFYIHGHDHQSMPIYELLLNHTVGIALTTSNQSAPPGLLGSDAIQSAGFTRDEALLPYDPRSFAGYGLLTEYFMFPKKFSFFDLVGLGSFIKSNATREFSIYFFLSQTAPDLESAVDKGTLRLGCTPAVNLFPLRAEPIKRLETSTEYAVVPDARRRLETEVYRVDRVFTTSEGRNRVNYFPLYALSDESLAVGNKAYWQAHRRQARNEAGQPVPGTEVSLSITDEGPLRGRAEQTLIVETTCLNRDLPNQISSPSVLSLAGGPLFIECLAGPSATVRPGNQHRGMWSLVSHLTLNQLSVTDTHRERSHREGSGAAALRRILELYEFNDDAAMQKRIAGIFEVTSQMVVDRLESAPSGVCRGTEIAIDFSMEQFQDPGQGLFLFASVLEKFLASYCSINSFTRVVARARQGRKVIRRWPPNAGDQTLI